MQKLAYEKRNQRKSFGLEKYLLMDITKAMQKGINISQKILTLCQLMINIKL